MSNTITLFVITIKIFQSRDVHNHPQQMTRHYVSVHVSSAQRFSAFASVQPSAITDEPDVKVPKVLKLSKAELTSC